MTTEWWCALGFVLLLGLQTSISPCPLTINITAISYMARNVSKTRDVLLSGLLYTTGWMLAYVLLAVLILSAVSWSGETTTRFLQTRIHGYLGPMLIVIGMMLLGMISFPIGGVQGEKMQSLADKLGLWSALPLGAVFAMAFCPTTAATFLAMIALATQFRSNVLFPTAFCIGTAIPVLVFAGIIALNAQKLGKTFAMINRIDQAMRTISGVLFIAVGIWFSLRHVFMILE